MNVTWDDVTSYVALQHWFYGPSRLSFYENLGPFVYFIQSGDTIKIGCSNTPELRVGQLQRGGGAKRPSAGLSPEARLVTYGVGGYELEGKLHKRFANSHDRGEWFFITDELIALVDRIAAEQARLEVSLHDEWYQSAVESHGWPPATFDLEAFTQKQIHSKATGLRWYEIDNPELLETA